MLKLGDDSIHIGLKARPVVGCLGLVPHGVRLAGEPGPGLGFFGGDGTGLTLIAAEHTDLVEQLRVVDLPPATVSRANERTSSTDFSLVSSL